MKKGSCPNCRRSFSLRRGRRKKCPYCECRSFPKNTRKMGPVLAVYLQKLVFSGGKLSADREMYGYLMRLKLFSKLTDQAKSLAAIAIKSHPSKVISYSDAYVRLDGVPAIGLKWQYE